MKILMYRLPSPDGNGNPGTLESSFSCQKKATKGSSFCGLEKPFIK
jgi:hypothetical protein